MENSKQFVTDIADINENFPQWYTDVVLKTDMVDYGPVKGTMVIKPYGYAIWENIQNYLDKKFKKQGVQNAYFPLLIPESYLKKEAEHVEGFAPEVAVVTYAGGEELNEKLIIRPTSETIICSMYAKWINSYRDLPVKMNQWCNVMRWEKTPRPFLRTSEFLWQEGHTVQASAEDADKDVQTMLKVYADCLRDLMAIPTLTGRKTENEKFAGAVATYSMEAIMKDGKCLQAGTSHDLGQNFAKASDIKFLNKDGKLEYGYSTSWGVSTRLIGALVMVHGDERGLRMPPNVAPIQTVIIPIASKKEGVIEKCEEVQKCLESENLRIKLDNSNNTPGWKFNEYEMKGVPLRLEIGPRDIENGVATAVRRDTHEKVQLNLNNIVEEVKNLLADIQSNMLTQAEEILNKSIIETNDYEEMIKAVNDKKVAISYHCANPDCEEEIRQKTTIKTRVIHSYDENHKCIYCGKPSKYRVYFGKQ
ncbi:MAG: proline--tRNA ligase, partial [Clostridia bacterium]|nr:proline--tRNA ligase [Clostridia bacterium]